MKWIGYAVALISLPAMANIAVDDYRFYATDYRLDSPKERFIAYVLKSDPCIYVKLLKSNETTRYCKLGDSGLDLGKDAPTVYATRINVDGGGVRFIAAAPWNEQDCDIDIYNKTIHCIPTSRN
ncbi:hypothetical protein [Vibrio sp. T11.5]|uniref:hypothetical protein n=1 Tax=Vibrio sp. T11.5 TaxID=2998836 RepID=UPI0022CD499A|nr:hypothetical protein [Vibrio sp. T11.5]MDA0117331.1 hypothetical protein [Vibrio sp. T11.5]